MKNRLMKIVSALCVLAMLFAVLPIGWAEDGQGAAQQTPVQDEAPQIQESAGEKPVQVTVTAPAAAEDIILAEQKDADPADGEATVLPEENIPGSGDEEMENAVPADEEEPSSEAAEEPVPAEEAAAPADEEVALADSETSVPAEEFTPAGGTVPAEDADAADEAEGKETSAEKPEEEKKESEEGPAKTSEASPEAKPEAEPEEELAEEADEQEEEEPVQLMAGEELTDTVCVGEEYRIRLIPSETGTVLLTLILDRGQAVNVRIDEEEADLTDIDPENPARAVYTDELQVTEWQDVSVCLTADADTVFTLKTELIAAEPAMDTEGPAEEAEEPAEENEETADGETEAVPDGGADEEFGEDAAQEPECLRESDLRMLEAGCIRVMVIRENGTALYASREENAEPVSSLACGDVIWARPVGEIWGEVYLDEDSAPLYFNLNNVMLQLGEVGYDVPIRKVKLSSSLEGLTEITEGTFVVMSAEISGFMTDEIADITWQYRASEDEEFTDIEDAKGFTYVYPVSAENLHYEWRIVLTIKS